MKTNIIYILLALVLCFQSCRKDEVDSEIIIVTPKGEEEDSNLTIYVTDEDSAPIANAEVTIRESKATTDDNGVAKLEMAKFDSKGEVVTVKSANYFSTYKRVLPAKGEQTFMQVALITKGQADGDVSASSGGVVTDKESGASVNLPNNGFVVDGTNSTYNGDVKVYLHHFAADDFGITRSMPGNLHALNKSGEEVQLATLGMLMVELQGAGGEDLNLADGVSAVIAVPVPQTLQGDAPSEIPLWSLDESSGLWLEESTASLVGGAYEGEVSHFSFWNCDAPYPLVNVTGKVVTEDGRPIAFSELVVTTTDEWISGSGFTDENGIFSGKMPAGEELQLRLVDACGTARPPIVLPVMTTDTDLGTFTVASVEGATIVGSVTNCQGDPLQNGYVIVETDDLPQRIIPVENGMVDAFIDLCGTSEVSITAVDLDDKKQSAESVITITGVDTYDFGVISTCDILPEYIIMTYATGAVSTLDIKAVVKGNGIRIEGEGDGGQMIIELDGYTVGTQTISRVFHVFPSTLRKCLGQSDFDCDGVLNAQVTTSGVVGDVIEGTIVGELYEGDVPIAVEIDFKAEIDDIQESVSGLLWFDVNENGIREAGETNLNSLAYDVMSNGLTTKSETNTDGTYEAFVSVDKPYEIKILVNNLEVTLQDQGTDDTVDSDFDPATLTFTGQTSLGQSVTNVDCGFKRPPSAGCDIFAIGGNCEGGPGLISLGLEDWPQGQFVTYRIEGGTLTDPETVSTSNSNFFFAGVLEGEEYTITAIVNGVVECVETVVIPEYEPMIMNVGIFTTNCILEEGVIWPQVKEAPFQSQYSFLWSNGSTSQQIEDVSAGTYTVTVSDGKGCSEEFTYVAEFNDQRKISGVVWDDKGTEPGVFDTGDERLRGKSVLLSDSLGNVSVSITDQGGRFEFYNLVEGTYKLSIELEASESLAPKDQGTDEYLDSDFDPVTLETEVIVLGSGCIIMDDLGAAIIR